MILVEGSISVKACLLGGKRKVHCVYVDESKHDKNTHFILAKAKENHVRIVYTTREKIDAMASGRTHGGILAEVEQRQYQTLQDAMQNTPLLFVLEGVEDPFNLGYVIRSLYSAGCTGLILRNRDWSLAESTILKSSAGAFEYLNIILSDDIPSLIREVKKEGVHTYAAMRKDACIYWEKDYTHPCLIAIGGEIRGLSSKVLEEIEENIYIPYANDFRAALNASGAANVIAFEVFRQRNTF